MDQCLILFFYLLLGATAGPTQAPPAKCTLGCNRITDGTLPCLSWQKCNSSYVRDWTHFRTGCRITACENGIIQVDGNENYYNYLACENDRWCSPKEDGAVKCFDNPKVTCGFFKSGCMQCPKPPVSKECPPGRDCDSSQLKLALRAGTECNEYTCNEGFRLFVKDGAIWEDVDYLDCSINKFWRLQSVQSLMTIPQLTCAKEIQPARTQAEGCSEKCARITDGSLPCLDWQKCNSTYLRDIHHYKTGCRITACENGIIQVNRNANYYNYLTCQNNQWCSSGEGGAVQCFDQTRVTCAFFKSGCTKCPEPAVAKNCPPGRKCDGSKLSLGLRPNNECSSYTCAQGYRLFAHLSAKEGGAWEEADYLDCSINKFWRLQSVQTILYTPEVTCAIV